MQNSKLILLFKGLKGRASKPCDDLQPPNRRRTNQHPMAFQVPYARTDIYKYSFFPDTIRDWNALPASIISAESSEDTAARFTSREIQRLVFAIVGPGEWMSIDVSPVKYSDSDSWTERPIDSKLGRKYRDDLCIKVNIKYQTGLIWTLWSF